MKTLSTSLTKRTVKRFRRTVNSVNTGRLNTRIVSNNEKSNYGNYCFNIYSVNFLSLWKKIRVRGDKRVKRWPIHINMDTKRAPIHEFINFGTIFINLLMFLFIIVFIYSLPNYFQYQKYIISECGRWVNFIVSK